MALAILLCFFATESYARSTDSTISSPSSSSALLFYLSSGFGLSPANIGSSLWALEAMAGEPLFNGDFIWLGTAPMIVPKFHLEDNVGDGFIPIAIEYDHRLSHSNEERPFLYGGVSAGPQFGDHSNRAFFHTWMASAGAGMADGGRSGFLGKFGVAYTALRTGSGGLFVVLSSGIYF